MNRIEYRYFRLTGKHRQMAEKWWEERKAAMDRLKVWLSQFGTDEFLRTSGHQELVISGVKCDGEPPVGWRQHKQSIGFMIPDTRKNQKKEVREKGQRYQQEMESLKHGRARELLDLVVGEIQSWILPAEIPGSPFTSYMVDAQVVNAGSEWFLLVPKGVVWEPPVKLNEIKEWEYLKAVEQPQSDGAASGVGDGLAGLRKAIQEELSRERRSVDPLIAKDIYRKAVGIVRHHFARSTLVAFERRDFELLEKHDIWPYRKHPHADFNTSNYPDYLTALRAAIAEARRREGEVQDER